MAEEALIYACRLDGKGGAAALDWDGIRAGDGDLWVHLHGRAERTRAWLEHESGLDALVVEALLADETRPRCEVLGDGVHLNLRGVNLHPGADPEDMVSLRLWIEPHRVISVRRRRLMAVQDLRDSIAAGRGPRSAGEVVTRLAGRLVARMEPVISDLDDAVDTLEDAVIGENSGKLRARLGALRRQAISLRRYIAPQREALARLISEDLPWLDSRLRSRLREAADAVTRYTEDLDAARERAVVISEEMATRLSEQMNRTIYILTIVATIMLPLGFLTGLLGINVGGIPGADSPWGFVVVCALLAALVAAEVWLFRRFGWF